MFDIGNSSNPDVQCLRGILSTTSRSVQNIILQFNILSLPRAPPKIIRGQYSSSFPRLRRCPLVELKLIGDEKTVDDVLAKLLSGKGVMKMDKLGIAQCI